MSNAEVQTKETRIDLDTLTAAVVEDMKVCPSGGEHQWRMMSWQERIDYKKYHSYASAAPIIEAGPRYSNAQMVCCCGLTLSYSRESYR